MPLQSLDNPVSLRSPVQAFSGGGRAGESRKIDGLPRQGSARRSASSARADLGRRWKAGLLRGGVALLRLTILAGTLVGVALLVGFARQAGY